MQTFGGQMHRANARARTSEDYYRVNIFIPILDHFIISFTDRFSAH